MNGRRRPKCHVLTEVITVDKPHLSLSGLFLQLQIQTFSPRRKWRPHQLKAAPYPRPWQDPASHLCLPPCVSAPGERERGHTRASERDVSGHGYPGQCLPALPGKDSCSSLYKLDRLTCACLYVSLCCLGQIFVSTIMANNVLFCSLPCRCCLLCVWDP